MTEEIIVSNDVRLKVDLEEADDHIDLSMYMKNQGNCRLHWGLSRKISKIWKLPPEPLWPAGSIVFGDTAIQSPFESDDDESRIKLSINKSADFGVINFAFYYPDLDIWDNNHGKNYFIKLPMSEVDRPDTIKALEETLSGEVLFKESFEIDDEGILSVAVTRENDTFQINFITDILGKLLLHWGGAFKNPFEWRLPPDTTEIPYTFP